MVKSNSIEGEHRLWDAYYDFEDPLFLSLSLIPEGLILETSSRLGQKSAIPLTMDPHWNFRKSRILAQGKTPASPLRDLINQLEPIASWMEAHPDKTFVDYLMFHKLSS